VRIVFGWPARTGAIKKPTAVSSRGFLSRISSGSTSDHGVVCYDYQEFYLSNYFLHKGGGNYREAPDVVKKLN